jgi:hypothetical protein
MYVKIIALLGSSVFPDPFLKNPKNGSKSSRDKACKILDPPTIAESAEDNVAAKIPTDTIIGTNAMSDIIDRL